MKQAAVQKIVGDAIDSKPNDECIEMLDEIIGLLRRQQDAILASPGNVKENVRRANEIDKRIAQFCKAETLNNDAPWNKIINPPKENIPLILSDGDSIYAGFYGKMFFKHGYHAWGTNAHIKYWKYAPIPPNSRKPAAACHSSC